MRIIRISQQGGFNAREYREMTTKIDDPRYVSSEAARREIREADGNATIAYTGGPPAWREGDETLGDEFNQRVLKPILPASLHAIRARAESEGVANWFGHVAWGYSRGYLALNGKLAKLRVEPKPRRVSARDLKMRETGSWD
jgi:hypothetical protein